MIGLDGMQQQKQRHTEEAKFLGKECVNENGKWKLISAHDYREQKSHLMCMAHNTLIFYPAYHIKYKQITLLSTFMSAHAINNRKL